MPPPLLLLVLLLLHLPISTLSASDYLYEHSLNVKEIEFPTIIDTTTYPEALLATLPDPKTLTPLIIKFYSPWCGHCKHYQPTWESIGSTFLPSSPPSSPVTIAAVSCTKYGKACEHYKVHGYPTLLAFYSDVDKAKEPVTVSRKGGLQGTVDTITDLYKLPHVKSMEWNKKTTRSVPKPLPPPPPNPSSHNALYTDITTALLFTFLHNIYLATPPSVHAWGGGPTKNTYADHVHVAGYDAVTEPWGLRGFAEGVRYSIPEGGAVISSLATTLDYVIGGITAQIANPETFATRESWHDFVLGTNPSFPPPADLWSGAYITSAGPHSAQNLPTLEFSKHCTGPIPSINTGETKARGVGYTCAIWELGHVISVGASEAFKSGRGKVVGGNQLAEVWRSFMAEFFPCEECQVNFLKSYDDCDFDRCSIVEDVPFDFPVKSAANVLSEAVSLWFFEMHNAVTFRIAQETKKDGSPLTEKEMHALKWPSASQCADCWDGLQMMERKVYDFLRRTYWEGEVTTVLTLSIAGHGNRSIGAEDTSHVSAIGLFLLVGGVVLFAMLAKNKGGKKQHLKR